MKMGGLQMRSVEAQCSPLSFGSKRSPEKSVWQPLDVMETNPFKSGSWMRSSTFRSPPQAASGNWQGNVR